MTDTKSIYKTKSRLPLFDAMKALGCLAIVFHHLAIYGPMSDVVREGAPTLIDVLDIYAKLAVQMFFVLAGFLVAMQLTPDGQAAARSTKQNLSLIIKRYKRLVTPFLFAVAVAILITALVRPWFIHESLSAAPTIPQLLAHGLLLHDILGYEALSAGVWFVAIDFQLFTITVLLTAAMTQVAPAWKSLFPLCMIGLAALSLFLINRYSKYEIYAPYFFGAYGLGMLAYWSTRPNLSSIVFPSMAILGAIALWIEFRTPVAVALATAALVSAAGQTGLLERWPHSSLLSWIGQRSYSIFVIHYGICIGFNALWSVWFPTGVWINAIGMLAAGGTSVFAGALLYRHIEAHAEVIGLNLKTGVLSTIIAIALIIEAVTW